MKILLDECVTIDKSLIFQQNLDRYPVTIVVLNSQTSIIEELITFIASFKSQVEKFQKCKAYVIER